MAAIDELRDRVARYAPERYPVQRATAQFHLGLALVGAGRADEAERALAEATALFDPDRLPAEHAKALNALGAALRELGRADEAAAAFERAAAAFEQAGLALEQGAALFNLGVVRGDADALRRARSLLDPERVPASAAAAARELGALLLVDGEVANAVATLSVAVELARDAGALAELGACANALGLALLAQGRFDEAVDRFRDAVGAHPRTVRPEEHAMAKANLALGYERAGDVARARLAARQALGVPGAPPPIVAQARAVLERVPGGEDDLFAVLDEEPPERWPAIVREEVVRWVDQPSEARGFARGVLARPDRAADLLEPLLAALLELPPEAMETLVAATFDGLSAAERRPLRAAADAAAARFHAPQLLRLRDAFDRWS